MTANEDTFRQALEDIANGYLGDQTAEQQFLWAQDRARKALAPHDQPGSPERETVGTIEQIIARTNSFQNAASHPECLRQLACINLLATRVLASIRTTPAPSVDSGNAQGWRTPRSLHWLGDVDACSDRFTKDCCGCVMYFATEAECNLFMEWMTARSAEEDQLPDPGYRSGGDAEVDK